MTDPYGFSIKCENLKRLYDYWLVEKGDRMKMPRKAISPGKIFSSLPQMVILDVVGRAGRFYTRYAGTAVDGRGGEYLTDRFIDQVKDGGLSRNAIGELRRLVAERRPVYENGTYVAQGGLIEKYERLAMPLSSDGKTVDSILAGICYKPVEFPELKELKLASYG